MRFLTIGNMYPPHHLGGYELIWQSAVEHLRNRDHEVRVLTTGHRETGVDDSGELDVHRELGWYWKDHRFPSKTLRRRLALERSNAAILARHLEEFAPEAVGWWAMGGMSLSMIEQARRSGVAAAGFVCDDWMRYGTRTDGWMRAFGRRGLSAPAERLSGVPTKLDLSAAGAWVFLSEMLRSRAVERWRLAETSVVNIGVDHAVFGAAPRPQWGWRLAYVGRLDPRKGVDLAIEALHHLPAEATLRIVGGGDASYLRELERLAGDDRLGGRVSLESQATPAELTAVYAGADAVVFPVLWDEPWGLVPLEAMAVGAPVVASGRGGSGEYLSDGANCLLFDPDRGPAALATALLRLAESTELRSRLREGGFQTTRRISNQDFDQAVEEHLTGAGRSSAASR